MNQVREMKREQITMIKKRGNIPAVTAAHKSSVHLKRTGKKKGEKDALFWPFP